MAKIETDRPKGALAVLGHGRSERVIDAPLHLICGRLGARAKFSERWFRIVLHRICIWLRPGLSVDLSRIYERREGLNHSLESCLLNLQLLEIFGYLAQFRLRSHEGIAIGILMNYVVRGLFHIRSLAREIANPITQMQRYEYLSYQRVPLFGRISNLEGANPIAGVGEHDNNQGQQSECRGPCRDRFSLDCQEGEDPLAFDGNGHEVAQVGGDA